MIRSSVPAALAAALLLVAVPGCAADTTDPGADEDVGPTETDEAAVNAMRWYDCSGAFSDDLLRRVEVGISATRLQVTDLSKDAAPPDMGTLDRGYKPSASFAGAIRYDGFSKLEGSFSSDVAHVEIIASKELKARAATAKMWIRTSGSGGDSTSYTCRAKAEKLRVDVSRRARLACSLSPILCTDDNKPGETCLADLFVTQGAAGASLRLTYLDHFGVRATERKETVGASTDLDRTATKVEAKWGKHDLTVTHRGGVTYTGTFKLPDGRSSKVQCNDLAMFD